MSTKVPVSNAVKTTVEIDTKVGYKVLDVTAKKTIVKHRNLDIGGEFYIYDLFDSEGKIIAQDRYVYVDSDNQPFSKLTVEDELILNPPIKPSEEMI